MGTICPYKVPTSLWCNRAQKPCSEYPDLPKPNKPSIKPLEKRVRNQAVGSLLWAIRFHPCVRVLGFLENPLRNSLRNPFSNPLKSPLRKPLKDPLKEPLKEPLKVKDPCKEAFKETLKEPWVQESRGLHHFAGRLCEGPAVAPRARRAGGGAGTGRLQRIGFWSRV